MVSYEYRNFAAFTNTVTEDLRAEGVIVCKFRVSETN